MSGPRCCFCGGARGGVYVKRDDPVAGPLDCCSACDTSYRERDRQTAALHSAEREVLEACVEEDRLWVEYEAGWNSVGKYDSARDARIAAVRRYRALLDTKAEGKEA